MQRVLLGSIYTLDGGICKFLAIGQRFLFEAHGSACFCLLTLYRWSIFYQPVLYHQGSAEKEKRYSFASIACVPPLALGQRRRRLLNFSSSSIARRSGQFLRLTVMLAQLMSHIQLFIML